MYFYSSYHSLSVVLFTFIFIFIFSYFIMLRLYFIILFDRAWGPLELTHVFEPILQANGPQHRPKDQLSLQGPIEGLSSSQGPVASLLFKSGPSIGPFPCWEPSAWPPHLLDRTQLATFQHEHSHVMLIKAALMFTSSNYSNAPACFPSSHLCPRSRHDKLLQTNGQAVSPTDLARVCTPHSSLEACSSVHQANTPCTSH